MLCYNDAQSETRKPGCSGNSGQPAACKEVACRLVVPSLKLLQKRYFGAAGFGRRFGELLTSMACFSFGSLECLL